eukprot:TRINITY_DN3609_c0_g1_i2.p1 TRINITY_DN3609_c0_g1~~TRINITY_DN3609_c0_g1_i2.p1  ORF type:complete len:807 (+),score=175.80 TRINITY_DN3609_c0_g1_i2:128-2548(+)
MSAESRHMLGAMLQALATGSKQNKRAVLNLRTGRLEGISDDAGMEDPRLRGRQAATSSRAPKRRKPSAGGDNSHSTRQVILTPAGRGLSPVSMSRSVSVCSESGPPTKGQKKKKKAKKSKGGADATPDDARRRRKKAAGGDSDGENDESKLPLLPGTAKRLAMLAAQNKLSARDVEMHGQPLMDVVVKPKKGKKSKKEKAQRAVVDADQAARAAQQAQAAALAEAAEEMRRKRKKDKKEKKEKSQKADIPGEDAAVALAADAPGDKSTTLDPFWGAKQAASPPDSVPSPFDARLAPEGTSLSESKQGVTQRGPEAPKAGKGIDGSASSGSAASGAEGDDDLSKLVSDRKTKKSRKEDRSKSRRRRRRRNIMPPEAWQLVPAPGTQAEMAPALLAHEMGSAMAVETPQPTPAAEVVEVDADGETTEFSSNGAPEAEAYGSLANEDAEDFDSDSDAPDDAMLFALLAQSSAPLDEAVEAWFGPAKTGWLPPPVLVLPASLRPPTRKAPNGKVELPHAEIDDVKPPGEPALPEIIDESCNAELALGMPLWGHTLEWIDGMVTLQLDDTVRLKLTQHKSMELKRRATRRKHIDAPDPTSFLNPPPDPLEPTAKTPGEAAADAMAQSGEKKNVSLIAWRPPFLLELSVDNMREPSKYTGTERAEREHRRRLRAASDSVSVGGAPVGNLEAVKQRLQASVRTIASSPKAFQAAVQQSYVSYSEGLEETITALQSDAVAPEYAVRGLWNRLSPADQLRFAREFPQFMHHVPAMKPAIMSLPAPGMGAAPLALGAPVYSKAGSLALPPMFMAPG